MKVQGAATPSGIKHPDQPTDRRHSSHQLISGAVSCKEGIDTLHWDSPCSSSQASPHCPELARLDEITDGPLTHLKCLGCLADAECLAVHLVAFLLFSMVPFHTNLHP
jgi:hypothetical protein